MPVDVSSRTDLILVQLISHVQCPLDSVIEVMLTGCIINKAQRGSPVVSIDAWAVRTVAPVLAEPVRCSEALNHRKSCDAEFQDQVLIIGFKQNRSFVRRAEAVRENQGGLEFESDQKMF